jgi:DNA-binding response OmpR family regulator
VTRVLLATDADWVFDEVDAALGDDDTTVHRVRAGVDVVGACLELTPELIVLDLQIGNMGGMAAAKAVRHEQEAGRLDDAAILMLLDRSPDVFLARRSDADGWLIKPLDAFRLRRAARRLLDGGTWREGVADDLADELADTPEDEPGADAAPGEGTTTGDPAVEAAVADAG